MTITEPNFEELQNLCKERGFHDINKELPVLSLTLCVVPAGRWHGRVPGRALPPELPPGDTHGAYLW